MTNHKCANNKLNTLTRIFHTVPLTSRPEEFEWNASPLVEFPLY